MLLSVGMYILLSVGLCNGYLDYAGELLHSFVELVGTLYGQQVLSYNVHAT